MSTKAMKNRKPLNEGDLIRKIKRIKDPHQRKGRPKQKHREQENVVEKNRLQNE